MMMRRWASTLLMTLMGAGFLGSAALGWGQASDDAVKLGVEPSAQLGELPVHTRELAVNKRDWKEARTIYTEMLEAEPTNALALANLGSVEFQLRDYEAAIKNLEASLRQRPDLTQTWMTLGMVHFQREDFYLALSAFSRAVAQRPQDARARNYLGAATKSLGWTTAAEAELRKAIELDPQYADAHFNLALLSVERTPPLTELARRHYQQARSLGLARDEWMEKQLAASSASEAAEPSPKPVAKPSTPKKK
jgi:tetratricopeptide (TPR) repeat protein